MTPAKKKPAVPPAGHGMWAVINTVAVLVFVTVFSAMNAQHFDESEIKLIFLCTLSWVGLEVFKWFRPRGRR